jgi:hypothetical protein
MPDRLKIAIADAVTIFSHIGCMVIESVWVLAEADLKRKKQVAKEQAAENIKFIRGIRPSPAQMRGFSLSVHAPNWALSNCIAPRRRGCRACVPPSRNYIR